MKPKDQMKTALLICALTSMSPAFAIWYYGKS